MGYSIAARAKSQKTKARMLAFLAKHYRPLHVIQLPDSEYSREIEEYEFQTTEKDYDWTRWITDDLSYDDAALAIGFDCRTSGGPEGDYAWAILTWIATRIGRKRPFTTTGITEPVPYVVYDGREAWPVLVRSEWEHRCPEKWRTRLVDDNGFRPIFRPWKRKSPKPNLGLKAMGLILEPAYKKRDAMIREELQRLSDLWEQEQA
jgi:hypothetical protein